MRASGRQARNQPVTIAIPIASQILSAVVMTLSPVLVGRILAVAAASDKFARGAMDPPSCAEVVETLFGITKIIFNEH